MKKKEKDRGRAAEQKKRISKAIGKAINKAIDIGKKRC